MPKLGFTSQFTWFCAFFIKSLFCFEANLQQDKLQYFWPKERPKYHIVDLGPKKSQMVCVNAEIHAFVSDVSSGYIYLIYVL